MDQQPPFPDAVPEGADDGAGQAPHLDESVRRVREAGRATLGAALDSGRALRKLAQADLALARSALGRAAAWGAVALVFAITSWLLLTTLMVVLLHAVGLSWPLSVGLVTLLNVLVTGLSAWKVKVFVGHTGMTATRRQLVRMGLINRDEDDDDEPAGDTQAGSGEPAS